MNQLKAFKNFFATVFWLGAMFWCWRLVAEVPAEVPVINAIAVAGTNLNFVATFPAGLTGAALEMRPTLSDDWRVAASLDVPADGGVIEFNIPLPPLPSAYFRLNTWLQTTTNAPADFRQSAELQFVAVQPLGPEGTNSNEAVFHFKGMIDGSDRIVISRRGALWEHVAWGWPAGTVTVNGSQWNPSEKNYMTTTGAVLFLPWKYDLLSPKLELITNRDVVALERTNDAVVVYMDDTLPGAGTNEFKIHFPLKTEKFLPRHLSQVATLKIAAAIDGSDVLKITATNAEWTHREWTLPWNVKLNEIAWDLNRTNVLMNLDTNRFLPDGVDLSTAKIVRRKGRDLVTMWAETDAVWVNFADNPNGADDYELEISFGR